MAGQDPYRRIPGETPAQRVIRINREFAERNKGKPSINLNPWSPSDADPRIAAAPKAVVKDVVEGIGPTFFPKGGIADQAASLYRDVINPFSNQEWAGGVVNDIAKTFSWLGESKNDEKARKVAEQKALANKPAASVGAQTSAPAAPQINGSARGMRNNNPGNIEYGEYAKRMGATGSDGRFAIFPSMDKGVFAQTNLLQRSYIAKGHDTPAKVIWRYGNDPGPSDDKNVQNYISYVSQKMGIGPNDKIPPNRVGELAQYMREFENGTGKGGGTGAQNGGGLNIPGLQNPFNPNFGADALSAIDQAEKAALTPTTAVFDMPEAPKLAAPIIPENTDFTEINRRMEAMKPIELAEREKVQIQRDGFFRGLGEALASMNGSEGLGLTLAKLGGGALMGRTAGNAEIRKRMDLFDERMAQYNMLRLQGAQSEANVKRQEAQYAATELNRFSMQQHQDAFNVWSKTNGVQVTNDAIIYQKNEGGKITVQRTPIQPVITAAFAMKRAEVFQQRDAAEMQGASVVAQANNGLAAGAAAIELSGGGKDSGAAAVMPPALQAVSVVEGGFGPEVVGGEAWDSLTEQAKERAAKMGLMPGTEEATTFMKEYMAGELTRLYLMGNKQVQQGFGTYGQVGASVSDAYRFRDRKNTTKTDSKGRRTEQTAY